MQVLRTPRPRKNRQWQLGIVFLVYSLMAVLSQETAENKDATDIKEELNTEQNLEEYTMSTLVSCLAYFTFYITRKLNYPVFSMQMKKKRQLPPRQRQGNHLIPIQHGDLADTIALHQLSNSFRHHQWVLGEDDMVV